MDKTLTLNALIGIFNESNVNDLIVGALGNTETDLIAYDAVGINRNNVYMVSCWISIIF